MNDCEKLKDEVMRNTEGAKSLISLFSEGSL